MRGFLQSGVQVAFVLAAFLAVLGCFTALALVGAEGLDTLSDAIKVLCGALAGVVIAGRASTPGQ